MSLHPAAFLLAQAPTWTDKEVPEGFLDALAETSDDEDFFAFCPNPFCPENKHGINDNGEPVVYWKSTCR